MEGAGEKKRKGGPLELDWERLLPHCDSEPPPMVVIEGAAADKSKPLAAEMVFWGDEDEHHRDLSLKIMSDKDLNDRVGRCKQLLSNNTTPLPDGGEKLRLRLRKDEAELERRRRLKADDKCKKMTPFVGSSICIGATDCASCDDPPPASASISEFASHFCSKLDEKKPAKSFLGELSTLNPCNMRRENGTCLPSRQSPFKSPNHLSVETNETSKSNCEQSGGHTSCSLPFRANKDYSSYHEERESATRFQPMRTLKRNKKTVVLVDEEELEVEIVNQVDPVGQSCQESAIYYPSRDDPEAVQIYYSDLECLAPESYLSSAIMNFYIRYLQKPVSPSPRKRCDYHFFNTYFYNKLRDVLTKANKETSFEKFRRWWKGVNIFEKAYIFLPIHENHHWSLIIICIPNKEDESGPIILHLDSLGLHSSKSIMQDVKSFLVEEWKFLREEEVLPELPIPDNIWDKLPRKIVERVIEVPQQRNDFDCGLFVLFFMERFLEDAPERLKKKDLEMFGKQWFRPEEASSLRRKINNILKEQFASANGGHTC